MNNHKKICFVIGNGESRRVVDCEGLKEYGQTWMCNAAYRDNTPDRVVSIDTEITHEIYRSGYAFDNVCYLRDWNRLPAYAYEQLITPDLITKNDVENIKDYIHESNRQEGYDEFVVSGVDLDTLVKLRNETLAKNPDERPENIDIVLGDKRAGLWITWCPLKDKVIKTETLPGNTDYQFCSGPLANLLATYHEKPEEIYQLGHDLYSTSGEFANNVYKGTNCYIDPAGGEIPPDNWILQHKMVFDKFPNTEYFKVNPKSLSVDDRINREIEGWNNTPNLTYITIDEMYERLNHTNQKEVF